MDPTPAHSDAEITACFAIMKTLHLHLEEDSFLSRVRSQESAGDRLLYLGAVGSPEAVTGFRIGENLAWGRFLYVDDLVTLPAARSQGHGATLLRWLRQHAANERCTSVELDSGVQRLDAHHIYKREDMTRSSFHFSLAVD